MVGSVTDCTRYVTDCTRDVHAGDYKLPLPINSLRNRLGFPFAGDYSWFNPIFIPLNRRQ